ncbi:MAG: class I SAM-dependent methyltransferase [Flavobacteriales bacterium]
MDVIGKSIYKSFNSNQSELISVWVNHEIDPPLDAKYFLRSYDEMPILEQYALSLCKGRVLDVGAAAGSHSLYLQESEIDVHSLEFSPMSCKVMKERGLKNVIKSDIFEYQSEEKFDTILLLMNGWGMGKTVNGTRDLIKKLKSLLNPNGKIIGDTSDLIYLNGLEKESIDSKGTTKYYGEVQFKVKNGDLCEEFEWIYPDPLLLTSLAQEEGLTLSVLAEGDHYDYLVEVS